MELSDKIIQASLHLFFEKGIKAVSMDDVSKSVGVSKRTLYMAFESKDALLMACIEKVMYERMRFLDEIIDHADSFISLVARCVYEAMNFMQGISPAFFDDLDRYNYVSVNELMHNEVEKMRVKIAQLIEDGKAQGLLIPTADSQLISYIVMMGNEKGGVRNCADYCKCPMTHAFQQLATIFLRGMATEKGLILIDDYLAKATSQLQTQR